MQINCISAISDRNGGLYYFVRTLCFCLAGTLSTLTNCSFIATLLHSVRFGNFLLEREQYMHAVDKLVSQVKLKFLEIFTGLNPSFNIYRKKRNPASFNSCFFMENDISYLFLCDGVFEQIVTMFEMIIICNTNYLYQLFDP